MLRRKVCKKLQEQKLKELALKKKLNGRGDGNGKLTEAQLNRLIVLSEERNETLKCLPAMAKQVKEMHEATMTKDSDGVSRIANAFKRVHDLSKKAFRRGD